MKHVYIVAGNYKEYMDYRIKKGFKDDIEYRCVSHSLNLAGLDEIEGFYIGTYYNRPDIQEIKERIHIIKSRKK